MKTTRKSMKFTGAYIPEATAEDFAFIAASEHRTVSDHVRKLIADAIEANADLLASRGKKTPRKTSKAAR